MQSKAATVKEYLASLPPDRRAALQAVRAVILKNLDPDIHESMSYGMIGYAVPHSVFPAGYHCDPKMPLPFAGLASQKGYMSLYLMSVYCGCMEPRSTNPALAPPTNTPTGSKQLGPRPAKSSTWARSASASRKWTTSPSTSSAKRSAASPPKNTSPPTRPHAARPQAAQIPGHPVRQNQGPCHAQHPNVQSGNWTLLIRVAHSRVHAAARLVRQHTSGGKRVRN